MDGRVAPAGQREAGMVGGSATANYRECIVLKHPRGRQDTWLLMLVVTKRKPQQEHPREQSLDVQCPNQACLESVSSAFSEGPCTPEDNNN